MLGTLCPFQLCNNMHTMVPIVQPYSQDAYGIGYGAFSALGWAEIRFGIVFLIVFVSIAIVSVIIISLDAPPPLSSHATPLSSCQRLSHRASFAQQLVVTFLLLSLLSLSPS